MVTLEISPQGQITLPSDVLQSNTWKNNSEWVMLRLGDAIILRPAHYQKTDEFGDLGGFFKNKRQPLSTAELCEPVDLTHSQGRIRRVIIRIFDVHFFNVRRNPPYEMLLHSADYDECKDFCFKKTL